MATFKHISSKNADYGAAEQYLTFEHDEFTMKPTLDETGRLILREDYRIATLISPIEQHSKKPDEARDKIVALMGDLPRVELFARQKIPGWDAWGNEIASDIQLAERS